MSIWILQEIIILKQIPYQKHNLNNMKGKIIKHENPDNTGMIHLCDSATNHNEETGREKRLRLFPINSLVELEEAHFMGEIRIYRAYRNNEMDYFSENEIEILNMEKEKEQLSKENQPNYFSWVWEKHTIHTILGILGMLASIYFTYVVIDRNPLDTIGGSIVMLSILYAFTIGIIYLPWSIYKRLVNLNFWADNE